MSYDDLSDEHADPHADKPESLRIAHDILLDTQAIANRVTVLIEDDVDRLADMTRCELAINSAIQVLIGARVQLLAHAKVKVFG